MTPDLYPSACCEKVTAFIDLTGFEKYSMKPHSKVLKTTQNTFATALQSPGRRFSIIEKLWLLCLDGRKQERYYHRTGKSTLYVLEPAITCEENKSFPECFYLS